MTKALRIKNHRWTYRRLGWWLPSVEKRKLATGPYEGWHLWWGPIHAWNVVSHNHKPSKGCVWR